MSKTRRPNRDGQDVYLTPPEAVCSFIPVLRRLFPGGVRRALDPCVGSGGIVRAVEESEPFLVSEWYGVDIREEVLGDLSDIPLMNRTVTADFLTWRREGGPYDLVLANPPYRLAMEFVLRGLEMVHESGMVAMLLRQGFVASRKRAPWMSRHVPDVHTLAKRPSFTANGGTDGCDYAWMVWRRQERLEAVHSVLWTPRDESGREVA